MLHLKSIADLNRLIQIETLHPLVAVVDFAKADENIPAGTKIHADFYAIMFKNYCTNLLRYGRQPLDFQEGSLICIGPNQVLSMDTEVEAKADRLGWGLFFHPDLFRGSFLAEKMDDYSFFSYETAEALHLSEKEKQILHDIVLKISQELHENIDAHSQTLLISNITLLLDYCSRYYNRQFITRKSANAAVVTKIQKELKQHFKSEVLAEIGLPTVKQMADSNHLSPSYLSDLLKKETGLNAQDTIHYYLIEEAKQRLLQSNQSVSEVAYALGFEYPQYFNKLFKLKTGLSPGAFRQIN